MNIPKPVESFVKRFSYGKRINPVRDWLILLLAGSLVFIGIVTWNLWAFVTVTAGGVLGSAPAVPAPVFNNATLDTIHAIFQDRAVEEQKYASTTTYRFADPSQ